MAKKKNTKEKIAPPKLEQVTAAGGSGMGNLFSDSSMEASPQNIKEWRRMLRDHQVASTWQQRHLSLTAIDWDVEPGAEDSKSLAAAEFIRETLDDIGFDGAFGKMHYGLFYGFSIAECLWARDGRFITLDALKVRAPERFRFDNKTGALMFQGGSNPMGEPLDPNKYWIFTAPGDSDDAPHGPPLGWKLYWPLFLRNNGATFWAVALEKFGMPTARGSYPPGASDAEIQKLIDLLLAFHSNAAVAFPEGFTGELVEAARQSGGDYEKFAAYWDRAVSKTVLSQTMTTDDGSSKSQSETHMKVADAVIQADGDMLCESFNCSVAAWLTEWNFPGAEPPIVSRRKKQQEDLSKRAERDERLSQSTGFALDREYAEKTYGVKLAARPTSAPADRPAPAFAAPPARRTVDGRTAFVDEDPDSVDELAAQVDSLAEPAFAELIDGVREILARAGSIEDAQARLLQFAADSDNEALADMIAGGMSVADLMGRDEVA